MEDIEPYIRAELCRLARSRNRTRGGWPNTPSRWYPGEIIDPRTNTPFTDAGAWEFIAELLEAGHRVERMILDKPPGKTGYVLKVPFADGRELYIKLQLGKLGIIGRSFHISIYTP